MKDDQHVAQEITRVSDEKQHFILKYTPSLKDPPISH